MATADVDMAAAEAAGGKMDVDPKADDGRWDLAVKPWDVKSDDDRWEKVTEDGGILKWVIRKPEENAEAPMDGQKIKAHYSGFLTDGGEKFDSSMDRGDTFEFEVGKGSVIKGWDQGFMTMKTGERAVLRCASEYAYGERGSPPKIPGGASLDFVVELVECVDNWEDVFDTDDCIKSKEITKGDWKGGREQGTVTVTYTMRAGDEAGKIIKEGKDEKIVIPYDEEFEGKGCVPEFEDCRAFFKCLKEAKKDGKHQFKVKSSPKWTYDKSHSEKLGIPEDSDLWMEMAVTELDNPKQSWEVDKEEKIAEALKSKDAANGYFKKGKLGVAAKLYKEAVKYLDDTNFDDEQKKQAKEIGVTVNSNLALVLIKQGEWSDALDACNKGLKDDGQNVKLLYRRAMIREQRGDWDEATTDLAKALEIDPANVACKRLRKKCKAQSKEYWKKQKALARGFFASK